MNRIVNLISDSEKKRLARYVDGLSTRKPIQLDSGFVTLLDFDAKQITLNPYFLDLISRAIVNLARETKSNVIIGPETGGSILVGASVELSSRWCTPMKGAVVRKNGKIIGPVRKEDKLLLVDDVINTGNTLAKTTFELFKRGLYITKAFAAIKREFPGPKWFREKTGLQCEVLVDGEEIVKKQSTIPL